MAMFSDGGVSSPDIWILITTILVALISLVFNPMVFRHNLYKKTSSIARELYMILSVSDFASSFVLTIIFSSNIARPKEDQCVEDHNFAFCQEHYYEYKRPATVTEKLACFLGYFLIVVSLNTTSIIALSRWYQISYPLRLVHKTKLRALLTFPCLIIGLLMIYLLFYNSPENPTMFQINTQVASLVTDKGAKGYVPIAVAGLLAIISTTASLLTVWNIAKRESVPGSRESKHSQKMRSAVKVLVLNAANVVWIGVMGTRLVTQFESVVHLVLQTATSFMAILQASFNPVVYVLLTKSIFNLQRRN